MNDIERTPPLLPAKVLVHTMLLDVKVPMSSEVAVFDTMRLLCRYGGPAQCEFFYLFVELLFNKLPIQITLPMALGGLMEIGFELGGSGITIFYKLQMQISVTYAFLIRK